MFWENFWPNFASDAAVAVLFGIFLTTLLSFVRKPRLKFVISKEFDDQRNIYWLDIAVRNVGKTGLQKDEVNWHLYTPEILQWERIYPSEFPFEIAGRSVISNKSYLHFREYNKRPFFPEREVTVLKLHLKSIPDRPVRFYYHFFWFDGNATKKNVEKFLVQKDTG